MEYLVATVDRIEERHGYPVAYLVDDEGRELESGRTMFAHFEIASGICRFRGQLPSDVKVGDRVELMPYWAGYWGPVEGKEKTRLRYLQWAANQEEA